MNKFTITNYYIQVAWIGAQEKLTWVASSALPHEMIDEFEQGIACQESITSNYSYGVMKHMISVKKGSTDPPLAKKRKVPPLAFLPEPA